MNLVTPDTGLFIWMLIIFGVLFFVLAKFVFPTITKSVEKRNSYIKKALTEAAQAEDRMLHLAQEQRLLLENVKKEQRDILTQAAHAKEEILEKAREEAHRQASIILEQASIEIEHEKERARADLRKYVAELSLEIVAKLLREKLSNKEDNLRYINKMLDELEGENKLNND